MANAPDAASPAPTPAAPDAVETIVVTSHRIACDGVGGALGHPRVWLELGEAGHVDCPYCDRRFVAAGHGDHEPASQAAGVYEGPAGH